MDFGRVERAKLDLIDFSFPSEPEANKNVLSGKNTPTKYYVGLSKWGKKEWIGKLYPKGTKEKDFLNEYVKHYNCIELNATHYKLYKPSEIGNWMEKANSDDFRFVPKVYQGISHFGSLTDKGFLTDTFLDTLANFKQKLGGTFLQVSDKFSPKRKEELLDYLKTLPADLDFYLEIRHPDWYIQENAEKLFNALTKLGIGTVITDTAGRRDVLHLHLTKPKIIVRFIANDLHPTDFVRIDDWVNKLKYWSDNGLEEVYFFVHCLNETLAPEISSYLVKQLNEKCNAGLKEIALIS